MSKTKLNGVYNKGVYWPEGIDCVIDHIMSYHYSVIASRHVKERIAQYQLAPNCFKIALKGETVEAEFVNGKLVKIINRIHDKSDETRDICVAVRFDLNERTTCYANVITLWLNNRDDNHCTIRVENYERGIM